MKLFLLTLLLVALPILANSAPSMCTQKDDDLAENTIDHVHDWDALFRAYAILRKCDDGGTAERNDELVTNLFANQWPTTHHHFELIRRNNAFKSFVLNHISATADLDALKKVQENAVTRCISGEQELCNMIAARAKVAIDALASDGIK
jgi:hypothetical protein